MKPGPDTGVCAGFRGLLAEVGLIRRSNACCVAASGGDAELAFENRCAVVVATDGAGPVSQIQLKLHQRAVPGLFQRLQLDPAPGRVECSGECSDAGASGTADVAHAGTLPLQLEPGVHDPLVVHPGQELAAVLANGSGGVPAAPSSSPAAVAARAASRSRAKIRRSTKQVSVSRQRTTTID